ncbi:MAG: glycosyl transferase, partial [Lentisphaerae bacterium]
LEEPLPFYRPGYGLDLEDQQPVIEHLRRALHYTQTNCGKHGLPLLGFADWNDAVNLPGRAESMFVACLYGRALLEMIELYEFIADEDQVATLREWHETMKTRFNQHCWDGEWYIRYLTEEGEAIGSSRNETGRIYTNAQSWPVLAGFATPERARLALEAVRQHLNTKYGIKLSTPGYNGFDPKKGGVTTYPPGAKENGGIFLHANPWVMIAETMLGRGNEALRYYQQINPAFRNDMIEIYECEPYCYAQNILGDEHPQFGLARNSWLSGTASWCYQAMTQFILGVRPTYHGLMVDPVLPDAWNDVEIRRRFRGCEYLIRIERDPELSDQDISIIFNGQPLNGRILPLIEKGMGNAIVQIAHIPGEYENVNA